MPVENELQDAAHMAHFVRRERRLPVDMCVPTRFEQTVALAQGDLQCLGQDQQRLTARLRATGFNKAHVTAGKTGAHREIELAHAACCAPVAQELAERPCGVMMSSRCGALHMPNATFPDRVLHDGVPCGYRQLPRR